MGATSRGFSGRRTAADVKLPPGQYLTNDFPAGRTPHVALDKWEFTIDDGTDVLRRWNWKSFRDLPTETITVDMHCVTRWSKLGTAWEGVSLVTLWWRLMMGKTTRQSCTLALSIWASSKGTSETRITVSGPMWTCRNIARSAYGARGSVSISELPH